jgi:hypothetical protein
VCGHHCSFNDTDEFHNIVLLIDNGVTTDFCIYYHFDCDSSFSITGAGLTDLDECVPRDSRILVILLDQCDNLVINANKFMS